MKPAPNSPAIAGVSSGAYAAASLGAPFTYTASAPAASTVTATNFHDPMTKPVPAAAHTDVSTHGATSARSGYDTLIHAATVLPAVASHAGIETTDDPSNASDSRGMPLMPLAADAPLTAPAMPLPLTSAASPLWNA